jgi:ribonuclease HII
MDSNAANLFALANRLTAGVDEAGRGPLAGPVVAAAVILPEGFETDKELSTLDDSKKLSSKRRETLAQAIWARCQVGVGVAEPSEIDRLNILHATMEAMRRALSALRPQPALALIDGNRVPPRLAFEARAIVGGDASEPAIAAASIIAKTMRDQIMTEAEVRFPGYGFAGHKGYPSPPHKAALTQLGPCPIHRLSYAPVAAAKAARG